MTTQHDARALGACVGGAVIGLAGVFVPGAMFDAPTFLAWLACVAAPLGGWFRTAGLRWLSLSVPGVWGLAMIWLSLDVTRTVPRPLAGLAIVTGLLGLGYGIAWFVRSPSTWAWLGLGVLVLVGAPLAGGFGEAGALAREAPSLARGALELSPIGWTLECAGWDWAHASRALYERSGVEFAPRHPHRVRSTGLILWTLGSLALGAGVLRERRRGLRTIQP